MSVLPDIDFKRVRPLRGTRHSGFEELCVGLFRSEFGNPSDLVRVEGSGGDGGVEAFFTNSCGKIVGLQAKYFHELKTAQWAQLKKSIQSAIESHPTLKKYVVAVPQDRTPKAVATWNKIVSDWKAELELVWWGASELKEFLSKTQNNGRLHYWFGTHRFDAQWLAFINDAALRQLDTRYTPEHHTQTYAERLIEAVALADAFHESYRKHLQGLTKQARSLCIELSEPVEPELATAAQQLRQEIEEQLSNLLRNKKAPAMTRVRDFCSTLDRSTNVLWSAMEGLSHRGDGQSDSGDLSTLNSDLRGRIALVRRLDSELRCMAGFADQFRCADAQFVLLHGPAGCGKSHLLATLIKGAEYVGQPALLLIGERFSGQEEPWTQVLRLLGWESSVDTLLSALDYAAEIANRPALLCIDALNESGDRKLWKSHLESFAARIEVYPNVRLVVSCREDFVPLTVPDAIAQGRRESWEFIRHDGFGENSFEAVASYFKGYEIRSSHFPTFLSEFQNPLFLRIFCEAFAGRTLPAGPITFESVIKARINTVCEHLQTRIDCPPHKTRLAIAAIAAQIQRNAGQAITRNEASDTVDAFWPGRGESVSLYRHLVSNGILVEVPDDTWNPSDIVLVRFPYERFSDYFIAEGMLSRHTSFESLQTDWLAGETIGRLLESPGIKSMMTILVPERFKREFISLFEDAKLQGCLTHNFLASFQWRGAESFTEESARLLHEAERATPDAVIAALLGTATIPYHPYNAKFLHDKLKGLSISDRELTWTIPVSASDGDVSNEVGLLLRWAFRVPLTLVSDEQAGLLARVLLWLCTSNHRVLRTRASLAAIRVLNGRGVVAAELVHEFREINDPYVVERLFAVANGVAVRERNSKALVDLGVAVFKAVFESTEVPPNILIRDSARSVLEVVNKKGLLPSIVAPKSFRPPYRSKFPAIWPESKIQPLKNVEGWREIVDSVLPENSFHYGDFGRYVMQYRVTNFSRIKRQSRLAVEKASPPFDPMMARRWIIQRVADLGWTPESFQSHERTVPHGRQSVDIEKSRHERIGKKYQWIALHEFLGYLSDHYKMCFSGWNERSETFSGPWQVNARDFDPSEPLLDPLERHQGKLSEPSKPVWPTRYPDPFSDVALCSNPNAWVKLQPADHKRLIEQPNGTSASGEHLVLGGHYEWTESLELGTLSSREGTLKQWSRIRSWLVPKAQFKKALSAVQGIQFLDTQRDIPDINGHLGLYPWGEEFSEIRDECASPESWFRSQQLNVCDAVVCVNRDSFSNYIPSPQLCDYLEANWNGVDFEFSDSRMQNIAFSPVIYNNNSGPLFVDRKRLTEALELHGLKLIWGILAERTCYDYKQGKDVADVRHYISSVYWLDDGKVKGGVTKADLPQLPKGPQ